jgi:hypothetical protein
MLSLEEIVDWQPEALKRKPDDFKGTSFYGKYDLWQFKAIMDDRTCQACSTLDAVVIAGSMLRALLPYSEIIGQDQILPHVHPNCRCTVLRVTDLADYIDYTSPEIELPP